MLSSFRSRRTNGFRFREANSSRKNLQFCKNKKKIEQKHCSNRYADFIVFNTPESYELRSLKALLAKKLAFCYYPTTANFMKPDDDTYSRIGKVDAELTKPQNEVDKRNPRLRVKWTTGQVSA